MHKLIYLAALIVSLTLGACTETPVPFESQAIAVPASIPATGPRISGDSGTSLILSWMEHDEDEAALLYSTFENGGWSAATTVVDGVDMFVNWADMPSVQPMGSGRLSAHWLEMSADSTYSYDVVYVQSSDAGATWSEPVRPHSDGTPTEHGFVSMFRSDASTGLIWLDGRKMVNDVTDDPVASGMTLRAALIDANQSVQNEQIVDEFICDCCQTDIAVATSGPVAVYRDRSVDEIRDISITRLIDGRWQTGQPVTNDNWKIPGCPVNGPSIIADGDFVAVASFTGAGGRPVVELTLSNDSGATFDTPIEVIDGKVLRRLGLGPDPRAPALRGRPAPPGRPGDCRRRSCRGHPARWRPLPPDSSGSPRPVLPRPVPCRGPSGREPTRAPQSDRVRRFGPARTGPRPR